MKTSTGYELLLVNDIEFSAMEYLRVNGLLKKDGTPYKSVTKTSEYYTFPGSSHQHKAITILIEKKPEKVMFIGSRVSISYYSSNDIDNLFTAYGRDIIIDVDGLAIESGYRVDGDCITIQGGDKFLLNESDEPQGGFVKSFMSWLNRDNGNMLQPLTERFLVACRLIRHDMGKLTGYANVERYLRMIRKPSTFRLASSDSSIIKTDSTISIVAECINEKIVCKTSGMHIIQGNDSAEPYVLFTTKPVNFGSGNLPFIIVRSKGLSIFISPFIANPGINLKAIKGGFDLLR